MSDEPYKGVRLVLGDPDPAFGKIVSTALFPLGLRDISVCHDGDGLRRAAATNVDIVVCDPKLAGLDFRAFAQDIRHGRVGANPFVILIATVDGTDEAARIAGCGIDEYIAKPIHPLLLVRRINALTRDRKPFVMTPGYVGPNRRPERREDGSDDALVAVPNTLRAKVVEKQSEQAIGGIVAAGRAGLDKTKATSGVKVVARLTRRLGALQDGGAAVDKSRRVLAALARMAGQVAEQHRNGGGAKLVPPIAERVAALSRRAEAAPAAPSRIEIDLLAKLAEAAMMAVTAEPRVSSAVPAIVAEVDGYLARA